MRVLYLAQRVPYPPIRGDKILTYHQIRYLSQMHDVSVACLAHGEEDLEYAEVVAKEVASIDAVLVNRVQARLRAACAPLTGVAFTRAYFDVPELHARLRARLHASPVDTVIVFSSSMAQYVEHLSHVPRIMQFADLDSQKWRQYAERAAIPWRWVYGREARTLLEYERHLARTFDCSVVVTRQEAEDFERLIPGVAVSCIPAGVDVDYFRPAPETHKVPRSVVFVGVMNYLPNEQGAKWLCEQVLPRLRRSHPDATVVLCGAHPSRRVRALAKIPGVTVTGAVPDVRPYLARAEVCAAPLQIARGIQNKVLEALAMGLPTVVTPPVSAGIEASDGVQLLVANDATAFANQIERCWDDPSLRRRLASAARTFVTERYRWEISLSPLAAILEELAKRRHGGRWGPG